MMINQEDDQVAESADVFSSNRRGGGGGEATSNNQSITDGLQALVTSAASLAQEAEEDEEELSAFVTEIDGSNNKQGQATSDENENALHDVGEASGLSEDGGHGQRKSLDEMQSIMQDDSHQSLHSSSLPKSARGVTTGVGGYSSRELDKIMEAHRLLAGFGGSSSGGGEGNDDGVISQRHSFGCKDVHPSTSVRKEELRPDEILRMSQSLRADMLPGGMMGTDCLVGDDHNNHKSSRYNVNQEKKTATAIAKAKLSKQQEEERDRAIREILGEYSSSEEEEEDEVNQKKTFIKAREKQHEEEKEELQQEHHYQPPTPASNNSMRGSATSTSFAARLARKQREMDVSTQSTATNSLSPTPRGAQHINMTRQSPSSSRQLPPRVPSYASSKTGTYSEASAASSMEDDEEDDDDLSQISFSDNNHTGDGVLRTTTNPTILSNQPSQSQRQLTPFQRQMQQQLSSRTTSSAATSTRTISTASSLPGAYPTAGIAPFANPHPLVDRGGGGPSQETTNIGVGEGVGPANNIDSSHNNNHRMSTSNILEQHRAELLQEEIVAICVDDIVDEENKISRDDIREEIIRSAAQADVVDVLDDESNHNSRNDHEKMLKQLRFFTYGLLLFVVAIVAVGLAMGLLMRKERKEDENNLTDDELLAEVLPSEAPSMSPTATPIPTLQKVRQEGVLRCGIYETTGFDEMSGERFGSDVDWCRAIAAAVHGRDSYEVVLVDVTFADRFQLIANGTIDVLTASSTYTMDRNVYEIEVETGLTFSPPFLYDGMRFAGVPEFVECADNDMKNFFECRDIMVCVVGGTSYQIILGSRLPKRQIVTVSGWQELYGSIRDGVCNVIAAEGVSLGERNVRAFGYEGNYTVGHSLYSKIPLSMVTRDDDPQWSDFVAAVLQSTFIAEQEGITQETSYLVSDAFISGSSLFGDDYETMFEDVIATIGNYGEFYARHAESAITREGLNLLNDGSSGLLFSNPFGFIFNEGPGPVEGGTLERIIQRGKLRCAVRPGRLGFAEATRPLNHSNRTYFGFDVDFCRALATSIFSGSVDLVELVEVASDESEFAALAEGEVDVLSGGRWTLQNDVKDPFTGQGFSFSSPYFYGADVLDLDDTEGFKQHLNDHLCMVTRQDDHQWSAYVYWLVASTIYAEEMGIDQRLSNKMPEVHIFGPGFLRMFRDPILEFGNIGELYARNLETLIPRSGRNLVNTIRAPGPQLYPIPGMLK